MTLSPEERASSVVRQFLNESDHATSSLAGEGWDIVALIAQAIRQACNEKLEEAASAIDGEAAAHRAASVHAGTSDPSSSPLARAAYIARSLKDKSS